MVCGNSPVLKHRIAKRVSCAAWEHPFKFFFDWALPVARVAVTWAGAFSTSEVTQWSRRNAVAFAVVALLAGFAKVDLDHKSVDHH